MTYRDKKKGRCISGRVLEPLAIARKATSESGLESELSHSVRYLRPLCDYLIRSFSICFFLSHPCAIAPTCAITRTFPVFHHYRQLNRRTHHQSILTFARVLICYCPTPPGIALQGLPTTPMGALPSTGAGAAEASIPAAENAATAAVAESRSSSSPGPSTSFCPSAPEAEVLRRAYGKESPINKYLDLALSDFDESFALLPQDANILDPRLMGPNFMNERVRLRMPAGVGPGLEAGRGWRGGHDVLDEVFAMAMQVIGRQDEAARMRREGGRVGRGGMEGNLSPESPLAQLFWQTFLPWNVFPTPSRPPPPPPRWL